MEKLAEQNRLRVAKHYEANKDAINAKRKQKYALKKQKPVDIGLSYEELLAKFHELTFNERTKIKYLDDIRRLNTLINLPNFMDILKKHEQTTAVILASEFSTWTKIGLFQIMLILIDRLHLDVDKEPFVKQMEILKIVVVDEKKEKQDIPIPTFAEYLNKVKTTFGEQSKLFAIASLYNEHTLRDDFILKIVAKAGDIPEDSEDSFIIINPRTRRADLIIHKYKTEAKYGVINVKLSPELTKILKSYIKNNNVTGYLFGNYPLSKTVSRGNEKMDYQGGVVLFRKMKVTDVLNAEDVTPEKRYELSLQMKHSPVVQMTHYFHKNDVRFSNSSN